MIPLIITCIGFNLAYVMYVSYQFNKMHQAALDLKAQMKAEIALRDAIILNMDSKIWWLGSLFANKKMTYVIISTPNCLIWLTNHHFKGKLGVLIYPYNVYIAEQVVYCSTS